MNRLYGTASDPDNVIVAASAMNALMLVMQALVDPGDVVVTTTPAWPNLPAVPQILSGRIRSVPLRPGNAGWRLDLDRLFAACDARTRVIFLNSPNNPTGWTMAAEEQRAVLDFARARGIWIVSDEVYARIVYDRAGGALVPRAGGARRPADRGQQLLQELGDDRLAARLDHRCRPRSARPSRC